jgi:hypothetical protein
MKRQDAEPIDCAALFREARSAFELGIHYLLGHTLPSIWTERGRGWQEYWEEAPYAGFYASCDGVMLLAESATLLAEPAIIKAIEDVYYHHLCPVLSHSLVVTESAKQRMRIGCSGTTHKLAKFVQASMRLGRLDNAALEPLNYARSTLISVGEQADGLWSARVIGARMPSVSATCEGFLALSSADGDDARVVLDRTEAFLLDFLDARQSIGYKIAAIWTLTEVLHRLAPSTSRALKSRAQLILGASADLENDDIGEFFSSPLEHGDYYHFNVRMIGAKAILRLFAEGLIPEDYLRIALPAVRMAAQSLTAHGRYVPAQASRARFWENYQAMALLLEYLGTMSKSPSLMEKIYMWVSPRQFNKTTFDVQDDYAVVLMPLRVDWSVDVFDSLREAAESCGFRVWRSDLRFKDDQIMQSIWEEINKARFVIADCTGKNPNVFYELGIAHTVGKPVFICAQKREDIPFDISSIRSVEYGKPIPTNLRALKAALSSFISELNK